jgi:outer membrane protein assembly factor BamC
MYRTPLLIIILAISVSGCSKVLKSLDHVRTDTKNKYEKAETMPDLEIPPGLSTEAIRDRMVIPEGGESAKFSTYQDRRADVDIDSKKEDFSNVTFGAVKLMENEHALSVANNIFEAWPLVQDFVESQGYQLELNDMDLGIIETGWKDESRIARNKFKIFAEEGESSESSILYISIENQELLASGEGVAWQRVARSIDEEKIFVSLLETRLSASVVGKNTKKEVLLAKPKDGDALISSVDNVTRQNDAASKAEVPSDFDGGQSTDILDGIQSLSIGSELVSVGSGKFYMALSSDYDSAWKVVGDILITTGFKVKQADKTAGLYLIEAPKIRPNKAKKSLLKKAQFWKRDKTREYQLSVTGVGSKTEVVILDSSGRWLTGGDADNLLNRLHEAVNSSRI